MKKIWFKININKQIQRLKNRLNLVLLIIGLAGLVFPQIVEGQSWGGKKKSDGLADNWSINVNAGLTSFFGDLSRFDGEIIEKITEESGPAFSGILTKEIVHSKMGISGQLLYGNLKGQNSSNLSFEASIIEYNIHFRFHLVKLISPSNRSKMEMDLYTGIGQFLFKTTQVYGSNEDSTISRDTGVPEFVYFFGAGLAYKFIDNFSVTLDIAMRQAQNDYLDVQKKNENFDYYSYLSIGVTYHIDSFKKSKGYRSTYSKSRGCHGFGTLPMRRRR